MDVVYKLYGMVFQIKVYRSMIVLEDKWVCAKCYISFATEWELYTHFHENHKKLNK